MNHRRIRTLLLLPALLLTGAPGLAACSPGSASAPAPTPSHPAPAQQLDSQSLPSFLPSTSARGMATGTARRPAMSYQGVPVRVALDPGVSVRVLVRGPVTPPGTRAGAESADCTWTITFSEATRAIPLSVAQLNIQDGTGTFHRFSPVTGTTVPTTVPVGEAVTITVHTTVPSGEGMVRWAPDGTHVAAMWDYVAELD